MYTNSCAHLHLKKKKALCSHLVGDAVHTAPSLIRFSSLSLSLSTTFQHSLLPKALASNGSLINCTRSSVSRLQSIDHGLTYGGSWLLLGWILNFSPRQRGSIHRNELYSTKLSVTTADQSKHRHLCRGFLRLCPWCPSPCLGLSLSVAHILKHTSTYQMN